MALPPENQERKENGSELSRAKVAIHSGKTSSDPRAKAVVVALIAVGAGLVVAGIALPNPRAPERHMAPDHHHVAPRERLAMASSQAHVTTGVVDTSLQGWTQTPSDAPSAESTSSGYTKRPDPPPPTDPRAFNGAGFAPPAHPTYLDPRRNAESAGLVGVGVGPPTLPEAAPSSPEQAAQDQAAISKLDQQGCSSVSNSPE